MASKYAGLKGDFSVAIQAFADQAKEAIEASCREIIIKVGDSLITMSPVGDPDLWEVNKTSAQYNQAVADHNAALRKGGRLSPGEALKDGMDIVAPAGYVGGRFRNNWMFGIGSPDDSTTEEVDSSGNKSRARISEGVIEFQAGEVAYITNSLPYAIPLEFGHSTQAPNGMVRVTVARFQQIVLDTIEKHKV
ncbi:hypothetical protein [Pseudomonas typographi]|uniref:Prophage PssSM-02 n=1 Tax=Pseudomonas typographi TaxID=2715964 RepID=A0ABR7Z953_9PSED|nr:hypothetical protein [Pseudomonas typographi]MBD1554709.1 hypothetical protein [Pseudomonas typographi]MBD1602080.1 hypothetical protein [Pseudomonas typographi]